MSLESPHSPPDSPVFDLVQARRALARGKPFAFSNVDVISCRIHGRDFRFAVDMVNDPVQRNHRRGQFYEAAELNEIKRIFPLGGVFVDIGANVGNHSLFVAGFLSPSRVIPFEPNPAAYKLLLANVALNGFSSVFDLSNIGVGVSDAPGGGYAMEQRARNLGGAKMLPGEGDLQVVAGDEVLPKVQPSMIKIDVEGMELKVLNGLKQTLERCRPVLLVEVDNDNEDAFLQWMGDAGYTTVKKMQRYRLNKNYLVRPKKRAAPVED